MKNRGSNDSRKKASRFEALNFHILEDELLVIKNVKTSLATIHLYLSCSRPGTILFSSIRRKQNVSQIIWNADINLYYKNTKLQQ